MSLRKNKPLHPPLSTKSIMILLKTENVIALPGPCPLCKGNWKATVIYEARVMKSWLWFQTS